MMENGEIKQYFFLEKGIQNDLIVTKKLDVIVNSLSLCVVGDIP